MGRCAQEDVVRCRSWAKLVGYFLTRSFDIALQFMPLEFEFDIVSVENPAQLG